MNRVDKNMCKSHMSRSANDMYKICPSNLSKQELEDLYFALFESNMQLKKLLNGQRQEIKVLTTKVQRLSLSGSRPQTCCAKSSAVINEQKHFIADLKKTNEQLSERIHLLDTRLCSAKQFLRHSSGHPIARCSKCCLGLNTSIRNSSMSALYTKRSVANVGTEATSCDFLDKENTPVKLSEIVSSRNEIKSAREDNCQQNKCQTTIDELKEKISILEEELIKTHGQYSEQLDKYIEEVSLLRNENTRVRAEGAHAEQLFRTQNSELLEQLRVQEQQCADLEAQLMMEKGKVSELQTRLKAAALSRRAARALRGQHASADVLEPSSPMYKELDRTNDDSGYTDTSPDKSRKDNKKDLSAAPSYGQDILHQIARLQAELVGLKHAFRDQQEAFKQNLTTINFEKFSQQISTDGSSSRITNNAIASNTIDMEKVNALLSKLREQDEDTNNYYNKGNARQTDEFNSKEQIKSSTPLNVSRIPRLKQNIENAITAFKIKELHKNKTDRNKLDGGKADDVNGNINDKSEQSKLFTTVVEDEETHSEVDNNRNSNIIYNSQLKQKTDDVTDVTDLLSGNADCSKNKTAPQASTSKSEVDLKDICNDPSVKPNSIYAKEDDNVPYVDNVKIESPKSRKDLKPDTNLINFDVDRRKKNEKHRNENDVKRKMSYVIETKPDEDKLTKIASDNLLGSRTYSLRPNEPHPRATAADSTDCEISSLTDLPDETDDECPLNYLSPGEQRDSTSRFLSSDTSLSEGELCAVSRSSYDEVHLKNKIDIIGCTRAAHAQVRRCRRLLRTHPRDSGVLHGL